MEHLTVSLFEHSLSTGSSPDDQRELLEQSLSRLFATQGAVEFWEYRREQHTLLEQTFSSAEAFRLTHMTRDPQSLGTCIFFVNQGHSWSKLQVSSELLLQILAHHRISSFLIDFVHCFGDKVTGDDNPYYGTFHAAFSLPNDGKSLQLNQNYEFCCHLRRFERHDNRQLKDPWSLRQMTAYQRYDFDSEKSTWVLIKAFQGCKSRLRTVISKGRPKHPMALHLLFLTMATENWRWYIDCLRRRLAEFTEKATFSCVEQTRADYDIKFADSQRLHTLESKLIIAIAVLEENIDIGEGMKRHCNRLERTEKTKIYKKIKEVIICDLEVQIAHLHLHRRAAELLICQLRGTCTLLLKVLDYRNDLIMKDYSKIANELAGIANAQNTSLKVLARETKRDSRLVKVLTVIAIAYLPANLIAAIFSSGLVRTSDQDFHGSSFHISRDFWIYLLTSIAVTIVTVSTAFWWDRRGY